jgi:heme exporter protein A
MLTASNLACERNGRIVFANVSFTLQAGQCAELRGPNGVGKSSLLRLMAGLLQASQGTLRLQDDEHMASQSHFIAHQDAVKSALTVSENLEFWCDVLGGGGGIDAALAAFRLDGLRHESAQLLSAGQRRRLSLARLALAKRALWLLDEPMTALDADSQDQLRQLIRQHLAQGGMVVSATHDDIGIVADVTLEMRAA